MATGGLLAQYRQLYARMEQAWQRWCDLQVCARLRASALASAAGRAGCQPFQRHPSQRSLPAPGCTFNSQHGITPRRAP